VKYGVNKGNNKMSDYQKNYWRELTQIKEHGYYINEYINQTQHISRFINCFLAVTSSSSIGAWIIWEKYAFIWGAIIAVSQVLNVIKQFLPYESRLNHLPDLKNELDFLSLDMEKNWFNVAEGKWTNRKIHNKYIEIKTKKAEISQKYLSRKPIPDKRMLLFLAKEKSRNYFKNFS
jgi:hypothetical protein